MLEAAITGSPSEATLRSYEKQARCEVPPHLSGSTSSEIKAEFRSPSVQLGELPGLGPHREMFMPGSRLMEAGRDRVFARSRLQRFARTMAKRFAKTSARSFAEASAVCDIGFKPIASGISTIRRGNCWILSVRRNPVWECRRG